MSTPTIATIPTEFDGYAIPADQRAIAEEIVAKFGGGATITHVEWTSHKDRDDLSKGNKHHTVRVEYTAETAVGAEYKNKPSNRGKVTGDLPFGTWLVYPLVFVHKGNLYGRVEVVKSTIRGHYFVDGLEVTYKQYAALMNPSRLGGKETEEQKKDPTRTLSIKIQNLRLF